MKKPDWMQNRSARRVLVVGLMEERHTMRRGDTVGCYDHYRDWLITQGGRPMYRAMCKAEARYQALKPDQIRVSSLHRAYGRKSR